MSAVVPLRRIQEVVVCSGFVGSRLVAFFSACEKGNNYWLGLLLPFFFDLLESFAGVFCSSICCVLFSSTWELLSAQLWRCCLHCYGGDDVVCTAMVEMMLFMQFCFV